MTQENFIKIERSARYYTLGTPSKNVKHLWFCIHGYGQLGKYFIRNFNELEDDARLIIVPEAMNRFYLNGTGGRVGATWMTKDARLRDIDDYCAYLNQLYLHISTQLNEDVHVHVFGFSQGASTAFRWVNNYAGKNLRSLHTWAGTFPPDIDYRLNNKKFNNLNISVSFASDDEFISPDKANELTAQLAEMKIEAKRYDFKGEHKIYSQPLIKLFKDSEAGF